MPSEKVRPRSKSRTEEVGGSRRMGGVTSEDAQEVEYQSYRRRGCPTTATASSTRTTVVANTKNWHLRFRPPIPSIGFHENAPSC